MTLVSRGRRWGAIVLFRLAGAILRGATALYQRHVMPPAGLRTALSAAQWVERAGARILLGRTSQPEFIKPGDEDNDGID